MDEIKDIYISKYKVFLLAGFSSLERINPFKSEYKGP